MSVKEMKNSKVKRFGLLPVGGKEKYEKKSFYLEKFMTHRIIELVSRKMEYSMRRRWLRFTSLKRLAI